jgi:hypothetical protein
MNLDTFLGIYERVNSAECNLLKRSIERYERGKAEYLNIKAQITQIQCDINELVDMQSYEAQIRRLSKNRRELERVMRQLKVMRGKIELMIGHAKDEILTFSDANSLGYDFSDLYLEPLFLDVNERPNIRF